MVPWNENQRTTTYLLFKNAEFSDLSLPDKVRIFNHLHSGERGENVTVKKLSEAFSRRSDERAAKAWAVVRDTDHPDDEEMERRTAFRHGVLQSMRDAVVTLGIEDGDIVVVASIEKGESSRAAASQPAGSANHPSKEATTTSGSTTDVKRKAPPTEANRDISSAAASSRPASTQQVPQSGNEQRVPTQAPPSARVERHANTIPSVINVLGDQDIDDFLEMVHYNSIVWKGTQAVGKSDKSIPPSSQIHFLGGPVHHIRVPGAARMKPSKEDFNGHAMVCRKELCVSCCGDPRRHLAQHKGKDTDLLLGMPFVHSSDCDVQSIEEAKQNPDDMADEYGRKPVLMRFRGSSKGYEERLPGKLFARLVQYDIDHGQLLVVKSMVCQKMYCAQCSSKKTVEDALERDRTLVEGRGWWRDGMDDGKQRESKRRKVDTN
ncbi:hypothetical protein KC332_g2045 [Hortaea werneckii]|nr:hypothetical protein KC350_g5853 [Hortaea werneckii]KAI6848016.1 hypothetical protein KC358_g2025 [Hortaea werneckii]KAI6942678.1 hypothetical protein KC341_g2067 [Hortaea werneckii]KAI6948473.1 hypothetical protein KC348_g1902 [Hortaea werneckii]KAI6980517.1 hypothetical protein KC321_g1743 [Hortaea werneckii]